jgi:hypothetical protein
MPGNKQDSSLKKFKSWFRANLTEKNFIRFLIVAFILMTIWIVTVPYDPLRWDKADATANLLWKDYYLEGVYAIPYEDWDNTVRTQSTVVEINDEFYVVNEKGPGHAWLCAVLGGATGTVLAAVAVFSTYMLGRRIFNWRVGAVASLIVMTNTVVIIMWHRYLWTDASTMHLMVLSIWLFVESAHRLRNWLDWREEGSLVPAIALGIFGGLAFGGSVSTRYPVGLVIFAIGIYALALYGRDYLDAIKSRDVRNLLRSFRNSVVLLLPFLLGLLIILVPLLNYNNTYFGGHLKSGYDGTAIHEFDPSSGEAPARNQSIWFQRNPLEKIENIWNNFFILFPVYIVKTPAIILVPYGIWRLRRNTSIALLLPWFLIIYLTYMSLKWVSMYLNAMNIVWEPRYFMPALPPMAIMAGVALDGISARMGKKKRREAAVVLAITGMLVLGGLIPATQNFKEIREGMFTDRPPKQPADQFEVVTTDQLVSNPQRYHEKLVEIRDATIVWVREDPVGDKDLFGIQSVGSSSNITVRWEEFDDPDHPTIEVGIRVAARGLFRNEIGPPPDNEQVPLLNIKSGTKDRVVFL